MKCVWGLCMSVCGSVYRSGDKLIFGDGTKLVVSTGRSLTWIWFLLSCVCRCDRSARIRNKTDGRKPWVCFRASRVHLTLMKRLELVMSEALWGFWSAVGHSVRAAAEKVTFGRGTRLIVDSGETVTFSRYQNMFMYICLYVQLTMDSLCDKILQVNFKSHLVFSTSETDRSDLRQILWKQEKQRKDQI